MAKYNAITGRKRKAARRDLPRKKRSSLSSTIEDRMYADQAMEEFNYIIVACQIFLVKMQTHPLGERCVNCCYLIHPCT